MKKVYQVHFECLYKNHDHFVNVAASGTEQAIRKARSRYLKGDDENCAYKRSTWVVTDVELLAVVDIE